MMLGSSTTNLEIYSATLGAVNGSFDMKIELTKVHKPQLLTLDNPNYATLLITLQIQPSQWSED